MNYELILKFPEASAAHPEALIAAALDHFMSDAPLSAVEALLQERVAQRAEGTPLDNGAPALASSQGARRAVSDEPPVGAALTTGADGLAQAEISLSFELKEERFRELCGRAFAFAGLLGMEIFDPQLSRIVSASEVEPIAEKWGEMRAYVLRSRGLDALLMKNEPLMLPPPTFFERHWKMILLGLGILVTLLFIQRSIQLLR